MMSFSLLNPQKQHHFEAMALCIAKSFSKCRKWGPTMDGKIITYPESTVCMGALQELSPLHIGVQTTLIYGEESLWSTMWRAALQKHCSNISPQTCVLELLLLKS